MYYNMSRERGRGASSRTRPRARPKSLSIPKLAPSVSPRPRSRPTAAPSVSIRPRSRPTAAPSTSLRPKARPDGLNTTTAAPVNISQARGNKGPSGPVNVDQDTSSTQAVGQGGGSGLTKASKATEDNVTVKRKSRGTSKYKIAAQPKKPKAPLKNPLVLSKKDKKGKS